MIIKKYIKSSVITERLAPKYARQLPWLAFGNCLIHCGNFTCQDLTYNDPDVNIYISPEYGNQCQILVILFSLNPLDFKYFFSYKKFKI